MASDTITILCSGFGLGFYTPGLVVDYQLRARGVSAEVVVLENLMRSEKRENVHRIREAFRANFAAALVGQKLTRDIGPSLDPRLVSDLLDLWSAEKRKRFIVFSGFWLPVLERYRRRGGVQNPAVDLVHLDSAASTSWKLYEADHPGWRHVWFFRWKEKRLRYGLDLTGEEPTPFAERSRGLFLHGGGWGIGDYRERAPLLEKKGFELNVVVNDKKEAAAGDGGRRNFMMDPDWSPWDKDERGHHRFPPFGEVKGDGAIRFQTSEKRPPAYDLIRRASALVCKPGAATLVESLSAATPLVLLTPYGDYEQKNARLWEHLGLGLPLEKWVDAGCSPDILETMHGNLIRARSRVENYVEAILHAT